MKEFDFVSIGDIVTDAFIKLKDADVHCNIDHEACELCVKFGAKIPYESVEIVPAVGNCANAAVATARLGLNAALVTNQGDDETGKEHLKILKEEKVAVDFVKSHAGKKTNYHYVLWFNDERTILVKHEEYSYALPDVGNPRWLYLTSLGASAAGFHEDIEDYLKKHPDVKFVFQPGTFQINLGADKLAYFYKRAEVFVCNLEEAQKILKTSEKDVKNIFKLLKPLGPKIGVITDGPKGAYVSDENAAWFMPPYPDPKPPFERTGAGDAFASTFTAGLALGLSVQEAITWAPINSMSVVQKVGARAGLLTREEIQSYLKTAPENYRPERI